MRKWNLKKGVSFFLTLHILPIIIGFHAVHLHSSETLTFTASSAPEQAEAEWFVAGHLSEMQVGSDV